MERPNDCGSVAARLRRYELKFKSGMRLALNPGLKLPRPVTPPAALAPTSLTGLPLAQPKQQRSARLRLPGQ
jgi:hypothetical protein